MATKSQKLAAQTAHEKREAAIERALAEAPPMTKADVDTIQLLMQRSLSAHARATRS